ncbi:MAG: hypothetical protein ACRDGA_06720, partial [Bacteroidota bacterium]
RQIGVTVTIRFPEDLTVHEEDELTIGVGIEGARPEDNQHSYTVTMHASGLTHKPQQVVTKQASGFSDQSYIVSSELPGIKIVYAVVECKPLGINIETRHAYIRVTEGKPPEDRLKRAAEIVQLLGIPALILLIASEYFRRRSSG